jgi:Antibiotic biosynthesis monooxygenase
VFARVNFLQTTPERITDVATAVRDIVHHGIREETGYVGYVVLGDGETGKALGVTLWQSEADREQSDQKARQIRPRVEQATGGTMQSVESYEVLFFDVPQS